MGVVYLARQAAPSRLVALKLLRTDQTSESAIERFRREAEVLARLSHAGIARVYEVGASDLGAGPQPWFAMEYVEGQSLVAHVAAKGLDRSSRVRLVVDLARAVAHAHAAGVVHRDLKPDNILVRPTGEAVILDFGVARSSDDTSDLTRLTSTGQVIGTLSYMAPEQARGSVVGAAADQYALGTILYELLVGHLPLDVRGRPLHDALRVIADGQATRISKFDPSLAGDLEAVVTTALADEPNRRYSAVSEFAEDLERWLDGRPVLARRTSALDTLARSVRRRPLLTLGLAATLTLLAVAATVTLQSRAMRAYSERVAGVFADRALLTELEREAVALWPADSSRAAALGRWLERASALLDRAEQHRRWRAMWTEQRGRAAPDEWLRQQLDELLTGVAKLAGAEGPVAQVQARYSRASTLYDETVTQRRGAWREAAERVTIDPRFAGWSLQPLEGLVPLGPDPSSGLEEFAARLTGEVPVRGADGGAIRPRSGDAIVLVLVPGGDHWIGGQTQDPEGINYIVDFAAEGSHFGPPRAVSLDPYLIGKFEVTQDQWLRMHGRNPSYYEPGHTSHGVTVDDLHPLDLVTYSDLAATLPKFGLWLPTEAQWEVAARGGSEHGFVLGPTPDALVGFANTDSNTEYEVLSPYPLRPDGYFMHWPVGSGVGNAFGLHDVLGNVSEICADTYKVAYHKLELRAGDGLVLAEPDGDIARRGGSYCHSPRWVHVYYRGDIRFDNGDGMTGLRVARRPR